MLNLLHYMFYMREAHHFGTGCAVMWCTCTANFTSFCPDYLLSFFIFSNHRVYADSSEKERLKARALELSLKFKFVTPLTSMVVTKPEQKDEKAQTFVADKFVEGKMPFFQTLRKQLHFFK